MLWIEFIICVVIVVAASAVLSRYTDVIAEKTGLGRAWVGALCRASPKTPFRVSWDGAALIVMYLGAMAALYVLS